MQLIARILSIAAMAGAIVYLIMGDKAGATYLLVLAVLFKIDAQDAA